MVDVRTIATLNLAVQLLLIILVLVAAFLAKKKKLINHCAVMRVAVPVQIIAVAGIMLPSMLGYIFNVQGSVLFYIEILVHHTLGLAVIVLWVYINLIFLGKTKTKLALVIFMRTAFLLWIGSLLLGLHIYLQLYL